MIYIYNTLSKTKEPLQTIEQDKVGIYVCGNTTYDYCHIGNARIFIVFDTVVRYLRARGYEVFYVRNITDIDDKIINRAQVLGVSTTTLSAVAGLALLYTGIPLMRGVSHVPPENTTPVSETYEHLDAGLSWQELLITPVAFPLSIGGSTVAVSAALSLRAKPSTVALAVT